MTEVTFLERLNKHFIETGRIFISIASMLMIVASGFIIFLGINLVF